MLKDSFDFVLDNYINKFKNAERTDPNYDVITSQIPMCINYLFPMRRDLLL